MKKHLLFLLACLFLMTGTVMAKIVKGRVIDSSDNNPSWERPFLSKVQNRGQSLTLKVIFPWKSPTMSKQSLFLLSVWQLAKLLSLPEKWQSSLRQRARHLTKLLLSLTARKKVFDYRCHHPGQKWGTPETSCDIRHFSPWRPPHRVLRSQATTARLEVTPQCLSEVSAQ